MRRTKATGFSGVQGNPRLQNTHSVSGIVPAATREISDDKDTSLLLRCSYPVEEKQTQVSLLMDIIQDIEYVCMCCSVVSNSLGLQGL